MLKHLSVSYNSITVENAGLILLNPFFSTFFTNLDLIKNKIFTSKAAAIRAVFLLEYLVNGKESTNLNNAYLNKVLCNIPYNYKIEHPVFLTKKEVVESDELLKSVIIQWSKLKNTSIDGLRDSFLRRKGELRLGEESILTIECKTYDILLDYLPWGISIIQLPWMVKVLRVDWR